jgi:hypothetical protein
MSRHAPQPYVFLESGKLRTTVYRLAKMGRNISIDLMQHMAFSFAGTMPRRYQLRLVMPAHCEKCDDDYRAVLSHERTPQILEDALRS